jgi:hypothetical protein
MESGRAGVRLICSSLQSGSYVAFNNTHLSGSLGWLQTSRSSGDFRISACTSLPGTTGLACVVV